MVLRRDKEYMKIKTLAFLIAVSFTMVVFSGCEELEELGKPDYITVTVKCSVRCMVAGEPAEGAICIIEIIKSGGERVSDLTTIDYAGLSYPEIQGTFKVYNQQSIVCVANVILESVNKWSNYTFNSQSITIPWNEINVVPKGDSLTLEKWFLINGEEAT